MVKKCVSSIFPYLRRKERETKLFGNDARNRATVEGVSVF